MVKEFIQEKYLRYRNNIFSFIQSIISLEFSYTLYTHTHTHTLHMCLYVSRIAISRVIFLVDFSILHYNSIKFQKR